MSKLVPIVLFSLIMAYFSDRFSTYEIDNFGAKKYIRREWLIYVCMALGMAVFVGLRTAGNDTSTYRMMYEAMPGGWEGFRQIEWNRLASAPGLVFVNSVLKLVGATTQDYFMLYALVTVCVYLWFIHKYSNNIWLSVFFFITMGVYTFSMAAIKQTVAVAFLLIATDRAIEKKYTQFVLWVLVAELFHPYAFIYLIVPFLSFSPWSQFTYWLMGATVVVSAGLSRFMGGILSITDAMGEGYDSTSFVGDGVNVFRVLVVWVPVLLSFLARKQLQNNDDRTSNIIMNLTMVNAMIMFVGLFGTANYFARMANYFLIFQTLALPWIFRYYEPRSKRLLGIASIAGFSLYFYYAEAIANGAFDAEYRFITLGEFLRQLF